MVLGSTRVVHPPRYPPSPRTPPPRVHLPPAVPAWLYMPYGARGAAARSNKAVGLISVGQLSLVAQISGFEGMTEVYNLVEIKDPNDHFVIPGNK